MGETEKERHGEADWRAGGLLAWLASYCSTPRARREGPDEVFLPFARRGLVLVGRRQGGFGMRRPRTVHGSR